MEEERAGSLAREYCADTPLIHKRAMARDLKAQALQDGLRTLKQDGIEKCLQGLTDLAQIRAASV